MTPRPLVMEKLRRDCRPLILRCGRALVAVTAAVVVQWFLDPILGEWFRFIPFLIAILFATRHGLVASLAAVVLSLLAMAFLFYAPYYSLAITGVANQLEFALNAVTGLMIVLGAELWRRVLVARQLRRIKDRLGQELAEHQRAEKARRTSEDKYHQLLRLMPGAVFACDREGLLTFFNDRAAELWGCHPPLCDPVARYCGSFKIFRPDGTPVAHNQCPMAQALLRGVSCRDEEIVFERPDGSRVTVLVNVDPIRDADGRISGAINVLTDITRRKQAEEARQRTVQRLEILSDVASQLLASDRPQEVVDALCRRVMIHLDCQIFLNFLLDAKQRRLHLNAHGGITPEVARDLEWLDLGADGCGWVAQQARRLVVENLHLSTDPRAVLPRSLGATVYTCHPLMNQGQIIGTLSFVSRTRTSFREDELALIQTVSDHVAIAIQRIQLLKSVQQRAAEAEEGRRILEALVEHIPMGIAIVDAPDKVRMISRFGRELAGLEAQLEGAPLETITGNWQVFHADGVTLAATDDLPVVRAMRHGEQLQEQELMLRHKDGRTVPILCNAAPIRDAQGRITGGVVGWQDMTLRKRAEDDLHAAHEQLELKVEQRTQQLAHANAELEAQVAERQRAEDSLRQQNELLQKAHAQLESLNTTLEQRADQLQAMAMELTQSEERERRRLAQVLHDHLQQLLVAARMKLALLRRRIQDQRLAQTFEPIDELLDQCISESRSLTVELSPPVLYDAGLAAGLAWLGRQTEEKHGLEVRVHTEPNTEPADLGTRIFLFQAVRELLFNVVKHARATRSEVEVTQAADDRVRIEIRDNGEGFDPNQPNHRTRQRNGFGLFSIRERLELIGGCLEIDAAPGRGSRVLIQAPLGPVQPAPAEASVVDVPVAARDICPTEPSREAPGGKTIRVLLADDHPILRKGLADVLADQERIELVGEASDGEEVVRLARRLRPDVVVMDVTMPRLNGIEATRRIISELPQVRVIGLSMHERSDMAAAMREAGAVDYLCKSHPTEELVETILQSSSVHADV